MRALALSALLLLLPVMGCAAECKTMAEDLYNMESLQRTADMTEEAGKRLQEAIDRGYREYYDSICDEDYLRKIFKRKDGGFEPKSKKEITDGSAR